jgi:hypothetical protein
MTDSRRLGRRQFEGVELVVVISPQINAVAVAAALAQAENPREEVETSLRLVGQHLDVAEMGDVVDGFIGHAGFLPCRPFFYA